VEFLILGPVDVLDGGRAVSLPAGKPLALLRVLLLNGNRVVSAAALIDELWGEDPPDTALKALQGHVSQLRKALGANRLTTKAPGYRLRVEDGELDLDRFELLVRNGRERLAAGDAKTAARELESALALWRGPAPGLDELRLAALEDRIEADLALGRHAQLVAELETLVGEQPLRERLRGQLMLALYRSGRQAEALEEYRRTRKTLVDELGIEPGAAVGAAALVAAALVALVVARGGGSSPDRAAATDLQTFVSRVENFLVQSREGRHEVSTAIFGVVHCRLGPRTAIERLNRVQRNRQSLLQQVAALSVPADSAAGRSASLFQQAEQRSIASDWHYRDWLAKRTSCGSPKPNADLHAAVVSDRAATRTKQQFVAVFDPLARRFHRRAWTATEF
jgi:DNA-binding SARP family transcriptional activator